MLRAMAKDFSRAFYNSKQWRDCRASYIKKVHGICERCGEPGLILHHKIELTAENINDAFISLSHDNLEYLCIDCHNKEHFTSGDMIRDGLYFDEEGQLVEVKKDTI